jgi:ATP-binding cassette subfamily B protein
MKKIRTYVMKYWKSYLFAICCMVAAIVLDMIYPQITKIIVNDVFIGGDMQRLTGLLIAIIAVGVGRSIFGYLKEFTFDKNCSAIGSQMRRDLFSHIQSLSVDYFDKSNTGELMARVKDDVDNVWNAVGFIGMLIIEVVIHVCSVLYCMFCLNWKLTFVPLAFMIACGSIAIVLERKLDKVYEEISEENAELTTVAEENLAGVRTVKAFAREQFEIEKFLSHNKRYYELNMQQSKIMVRYYPFYQFVGVLLPLVTTILGGLSVIQGEMDLGSLVAYVEYSRNCTWPMEMIGWLTNSLSSAIASRKKIAKIFAETPTIREDSHPVHLTDLRGDITFENVSLRLEDKQILTDISFELKSGKTLGIMGATGSGKTSIVNLLQRFYDPTDGTISMDGTDIAQMELSQVRGACAVVMQDVFLFSDTIEENIKMGQRMTLPAAEVKKAAEMAQASGFIEGMEENYQTVIGERGVGLSGGQKQRISIARALSKKSPILVLDDATSALDMETEREIQKILNDLTGMTKIIIAHRISAVRRADEIIYLEEGKIAERGTHEELLAKRGLYYATFQAQYGDNFKQCM